MTQSLLHVKRYTSEHLATAAANTKNEILRRMLYQASEDLRLLELVFSEDILEEAVAQRYGRFINDIKENVPCK